jgi:hypothetical protein
MRGHHGVRFLWPAVACAAWLAVRPVAAQEAPPPGIEPPAAVAAPDPAAPPGDAPATGAAEAQPPEAATGAPAAPPTPVTAAAQDEPSPSDAPTTGTDSAPPTTGTPDAAEASPATNLATTPATGTTTPTTGATTPATGTTGDAWKSALDDATGRERGDNGKARKERKEQDEDRDARKDDDAEDAADDDMGRLPDVLRDDLATTGAIGFLHWRNRVGLQAGVGLDGDLLTIGITPGLNVTFPLAKRPFTFTLAAPIRLELVDARAENRFGRVGKLLEDDWNEPGDYLQVLQNLSWGDSEGHFLVGFHQFEAATLGHGTLVRRYAPNLVLSSHGVAFKADAFSDWAGGEAYVDDVAGPHVVGGRVRFNPLAFVSRTNPYLRTFSLGFDIAADVDAPLRNRLDFDDVDDDGRRENEVRVDPDHLTPDYAATAVLAWGVNLGIRLAETRQVAYDTYLDWSFLAGGVPADDAANPRFAGIPTRGVRTSGITWGHTLRVDLGDRLQHGIRARLEYRNHEAGYQPGYFGLGYDVQRTQARRGTRLPSDLANRTQVQAVLGRGGDRVNGGLIELSYLLGRYLAAGIGFEFNDRFPDNHMFVTVGVPDYKDFQFEFTYHRRNARDFADLWNWFDPDASDVLIARTRYTVLGVLGIGLEAMTPFALGTDNDFASHWQVAFFLEAGWSFGKLLDKGGRE